MNASMIWKNAIGIASLVLVLGASIASAAAVTVGPGAASDTTTQYPYQSDYAAWFVADLSDPVTPAPIVVSTSGTAGRWLQELTLGEGQAAPQNGETFLIQELLRVGGGDFALDNWHQVILTPDWKWLDATIFDNATAEPLAGLQVALTDTRIDFAFDPLASGTDLFFVKEVQYVGTTGAVALPLQVQAFAVPEPVTSALLLVGAAALFLVVGRNRRTRVFPTLSA